MHNHNPLLICHACLPLQRGQVKPSGQRSANRYCLHASSFEKRLSISISRQNTNISYVTTGYIPAGRVRLIKMEALRNTGTHPFAKRSLNMLSIPRWKLYQTRLHGGAGRSSYKRFTKSILGVCEAKLLSSFGNAKTTLYLSKMRS